MSRLKELLVAVAATRLDVSGLSKLLAVAEATMLNMSRLKELLAAVAATKLDVSRLIMCC